jgi:vacuolar-type H+-ATPase subunit C/Vma6
MYDYGNARVAARRAGLLDAAAYRRLSEASSPATLLVLLAALDDWRSVLAEVAALSSDPGPAVDAAVERHRSRRLSALPRWYEGRPRRLVETLVAPLDVERLLAVVRRRRAGEKPETIGAAVAPGALLGSAGVGQLARAPSVEAMFDRAAEFGLLDPVAAALVGQLAATGAPAARVEGALLDATDAARLVRARGRTADARFVRAVVEREIETRANGTAALLESGAAAGTFVERAETLARLDSLAALGRRDPLGIGAVAGYIAAIEVQAIRLRAIFAGVAAGWPPTLVGEYIELPRAAARAVG